MLHTKFRENLTAGSGEDFEGFLPYIRCLKLFMPRDDGAWVYYKLTYEPSAQVS